MREPNSQNIPTLENGKFDYKKEYEFVSKLFYVEDWLFKNIINNFLYYRYLSFISEK